jgi:hypothetical protein
MPVHLAARSEKGRAVTQEQRAEYQRQYRAAVTPMAMLQLAVEKGASVEQLSA